MVAHSTSIAASRDMRAWCRKWGARWDKWEEVTSTGGGGCLRVSEVGEMWWVWRLEVGCLGDGGCSVESGMWGQWEVVWGGRWVGGLKEFGGWRSLVCKLGTHLEVSVMSPPTLWLVTAMNHTHTHYRDLCRHSKKHSLEITLSLPRHYLDNIPGLSRHYLGNT